MARHGYARISTRSQRDDSQLDALRAADCERNWTDTASGKLDRRPEWDNCLDHLRRGDELVVTRLSRMARSVRHLTEIAALLQERGIDLVVLKQGIDTTTPAGRFTFHALAAMDEMLADLISEGTREGLESARARGRVGGRKPKLTARQAEVARGMYDETGADGRRKYTVAEIAETFGVSRKTVYRHLEPSGGRRQPDKSAGPAAPAGPLATLPHPIHARISEPAARARTRPAAARAPLACPTCGREPTTRHEALQQREDLAIVWLHLDSDRVTEARHCVACQPHWPVIDVSCSCCGNGPLITGQPPELGAQLAAPALDWMHSRGWQLHPQPPCPADHR
jgi:DNA invertase Pin-like site-specific DNA recombinase